MNAKTGVPEEQAAGAHGSPAGVYIPTFSVSAVGPMTVITFFGLGSGAPGKSPDLVPAFAAVLTHENAAELEQVINQVRTARQTLTADETKPN